MAVAIARPGALAVGIWIASSSVRAAVGMSGRCAQHPKRRADLAGVDCLLDDAVAERTHVRGGGSRVWRERDS